MGIHRRDTSGRTNAITDDEEIAAREIYNERAGICEYSGLMTREEAEKQGLLESQRWRRLCELKAIYNMPLDKRREYFVMVKKERGDQAMQKLKSEFGAYWFDRKRQGMAA